MRDDLENFIVPDGSTIKDLIAIIDRNRCGISLVVDVDGRLVDTVTDGDIRRAILAGIDLTEPVTELRGRRGDSPYPEPVTAPVAMSRSRLLKLMRDSKLHRIPLLDTSDRVVGLSMIEDLIPRETTRLQAVIMAGGLGTRLRPLTEDMPKPMLPVGDRPLMELLIDQLRDSGVHRVNVTTHYKQESITSHFGDGAAFGVDLQYVSEDRPLGTAGAIALLEESDDPLLVINGDILTQVDFKAMLSYHQEHEADLTVGVRQFDFEVPYGVVTTDGTCILGLEEKPTAEFFVNAGIYLLQPQVRLSIVKGEKLDMTDLIQKLLDEGRTVASFLIREYWLDVGNFQDYEKAQKDVATLVEKGEDRK
jgi:dTDP-glucose pyrophosphorylase